LVKSVPRHNRKTISSAARFGELAVLGDSLCDSGNAGRFSDGPVWVERLAEALGLPLQPSREGGTNHAVGGARAAGGGPFDLRAQAGALLAQRRSRLNPGALHIVWAGGNDFLAGWQAIDRDAAVRGAAAAVGAVVDHLAAAGAGHLLVPNLPDLGLVPAVRALGSAWAAEARRLSLLFNAALEEALDQVGARHAIRVRRLDVFTLAERVSAEPTAFGFSDVTRPCRGMRDVGGGPPCEAALFWDEIHPTAAAHARLAAAALRTLAAQPGRNGA
jgi:outer membrane lipase/esterase